MRFDRPPVDRREGVVDADEPQVGVDQSEAHRRSRADDVKQGAGVARGHCSGNLTRAAVADLTTPPSPARTSSSAERTQLAVARRRGAGASRTAAAPARNATPATITKTSRGVPSDVSAGGGDATRR